MPGTERLFREAPAADGAVLAARKGVPAVGMESDMVDFVDVSLEAMDLVTAVDIPEADGPVVAA